MIVGFIPSRLGSSRLHQKPLIKIDGLPMVIHTMKRAMMSKRLDDLYVCTDSKLIAEQVSAFGGKFILTSPSHKNGTERIGEAIKKIRCNYAIDIQGDEPMVQPNDIDKVINFHLKNKSFDIIVPYVDTPYKDNKNLVKIISNKKSKILYFSRSKAPYDYKEQKTQLKKHLSIISFKRKSLIKYSTLKESYLEKIEGIELLRALENNLSIGTFGLKGKVLAVDVKSDISNVIKAMKNDKTRKLY